LPFHSIESKTGRSLTLRHVKPNCCRS
jgi:hypothetical protein